MLITFAVENWRSFKEKSTLSMVASKETQHKEHLSRIEKQSLRLLPVSAIYGANASGKTKFIEALEFLRYFILRGVGVEQAIPVQPYKLDDESKNGNSKFWLSVLISENIYTYYVALNSEKVVEESLEFENSASVYKLYERIDGSEVSLNDKKLKKEERDFLKFVSKGTRKNSLFLTNIFNQNVDETVPIFEPLFKWLTQSLTVITPTSHYVQIQRFVNKDDEYYEELNRLLDILDTGIDHLEGREIDIDNLSLSEAKTKFIENRTLGKKLTYRDGDLVFYNIDGVLKAKKILPVHNGAEGNVSFKLDDESLGTRRLLDLIPMFIELRKSHDFPRVYVIDELDSSLHTKLLYWLLSYYLQSCHADLRNQLIFTTHDVNILTQDLFRRDELWLTDRKDTGESSLYSIGEFEDIRQDKDIRKLYLNGLIGGIPNIYG